MSGLTHKKYSITQKRNILAAYDEKPKEENMSKFADRIDVHRNTVRGILNDREKIESLVNGGAMSLKRSRLRELKFEDIDKAVFEWFKNARAEQIIVSGEILKEAAEQAAKTLGRTDFKDSNGWLEKFKNRHLIVFKTKQGEASGIDTDGLKRWQSNVLMSHVAEYSLDDVYNADETGVFWKLLPDKTLAFKGEKCSSGKKSKERLTVLLCSNTTGTDKRELLIIGKSRMPRCFRKKIIPVPYKANTKAWMTDNCPAHPPNVELSNIELLFLPPNTTALSQVCLVQRVVYRKSLVKRLVDSFNSNKKFEFDLFQAVHLLKNAWEAVLPETFANCFRKSGVTTEQIMNDVVEETDDIFDDWEQLKAVGSIEEGLDIDDYLYIDENVATTHLPTVEEIVQRSESKMNEPLRESEKASLNSLMIESLRAIIEANFAAVGRDLQEIRSKLGL